MFRRLLLGITVLSLASVAWAGVPDLILSSAVTAFPGASVFNLPSGTGDRLDEARGPGGATVDATITVTLVDNALNPIFAYPFDDMWLETSGDGLVYCASGTTSDAATNVDGQAFWRSALAAGGSSGGEVTLVLIAGAPLAATLNLTHNSADMTGDLIVNLLDLSAFTPIAFGGYDYAADFNFDGVVNLLDLNRLVPALFSQLQCQ